MYAYYYVCKYSCKYTSELIYALEQLKNVKDKVELKVMSVDCGPCNDLFAFDYLSEKNKYKLESLIFRGIDSNRIWEDVHKEIKDKCDSKYEVKYKYKDIFEFIEIISQKNWFPDITIFNYVFSDMQKNSSSSEIKDFIKKFANFVNDSLPINCYILFVEKKFNRTKRNTK